MHSVLPDWVRCGVSVKYNQAMHTITGWEVTGHVSYDIYVLTLTSENGEIIHGVHIDAVARFSPEGLTN